MIDIDWAWMADHVDELVARTMQHLWLTLLAVGIGFFISFVLAIVAVRRRSTYGPILGISDILYTIPSLALFAALVSITGITLLTVMIPLVMYTLVIFVRNIASGFDSVPADVLEAANGMGYTRSQRLRRVEIPLAVPLIVAGIRLATVSTIGLVTVSAILGDTFGGLGFFILEGYRRSFPTELYFGAVPSILLAVVLDLLLIRVQRMITPWTKPASGTPPEMASV
ncbi:MAG TPA: ABC transporter permease [Candidatus Limnocylindrales bacterium]|jgi:osmoprotectant transport system permease protein